MINGLDNYSAACKFLQSCASDADKTFYLHSSQYETVWKQTPEYFKETKEMKEGCESTMRKKVIQMIVSVAFVALGIFFLALKDYTGGIFLAAGILFFVHGRDGFIATENAFKVGQNANQYLSYKNGEIINDMDRRLNDMKKNTWLFGNMFVNEAKKQLAIQNAAGTVQ